MRGDRQTDALPKRQAEAIIQAALAADRIGQPFTRMVTVHWEALGITDAQAADATGRLVKLAMDWTRRRGSALQWAWVRETGPGKGSHVHMLIACPRHLPIGRMWRRWLKSITGRPYPRRPKGVRRAKHKHKPIDTRRIGGTLAVAQGDPVEYLKHLSKVVAYVCKGVSPADAAALGLLRLEDGGRVTGKRSAVCQQLLAASRS